MERSVDSHQFHPSGANVPQTSDGDKARAAMSHGAEVRQSSRSEGGLLREALELAPKRSRRIGDPVQSAKGAPRCRFAWRLSVHVQSSVLHSSSCILTWAVGQKLSEGKFAREYVDNANWNLRPQSLKVVYQELRAFELSKRSTMPAWPLVCVIYILPANFVIGFD